MNTPNLPEKICIVCGLDCSDSQRLKDDQGRYYHEACHRHSLEMQCNDSLIKPANSTATVSWSDLLVEIPPPKHVHVISKTDQLILHVKWSEVFKWRGWAVISAFIVLIYFLYLYSDEPKAPFFLLVPLIPLALISYKIAQELMNTTEFTITPKSITAVTYPLAIFFRTNKQTINFDRVEVIGVERRNNEVEKGDRYIKFCLENHSEINLYPSFPQKSEIPEFLTLVCAKILNLTESEVYQENVGIGPFKMRLTTGDRLNFRRQKK